MEEMKTSDIPEHLDAEEWIYSEIQNVPVQERLEMEHYLHAPEHVAGPWKVEWHCRVCNNQTDGPPKLGGWIIHTNASLNYHLCIASYAKFIQMCVSPSWIGYSCKEYHDSITRHHWSIAISTVILLLPTYNNMYIALARVPCARTLYQDIGSCVHM